MPGVEFYEVKKNVIIFQKENGNTFTLFKVKSLQKEQNSTNLLSPLSDSTPWTLTLPQMHQSRDKKIIEQQKIFNYVPIFG